MVKSLNYRILQFWLIFILFHIIKKVYNQTTIPGITKYPSAYKLLNGNIFIISQNKITVYDQNFTQVKYNYDFTSINKISNAYENIMII